MLPEILAQNLNILFVGTSISQTSDELGFYYLTPKNRFWEMLEYAALTPSLIISASDRKALVDAQHTGVLDQLYKQFFFEKKESQLSKQRIGLTDLNRRILVSKDDDPAGDPSPDDIQKFIRKVEKYRPRILAFATKVEVFEK